MFGERAASEYLQRACDDTTTALHAIVYNRNPIEALRIIQRAEDNLAAARRTIQEGQR